MTLKKSDLWNCKKCAFYYKVHELTYCIFNDKDVMCRYTPNEMLNDVYVSPEYEKICMFCQHFQWYDEICDKTGRSVSSNSSACKDFKPQERKKICRNCFRVVRIGGSMDFPFAR